MPLNRETKETESDFQYPFEAAGDRSKSTIYN